MDNAGPVSSGLLPIDTELHGRYRIIRVIGRGGMSAVYEGEHVGLGKRVAIKEMLAPQAEAPEAEEAVRRFQNEARTLARLDQTHLPGVSDFFSQDGRYYLVMEYVQGETLEDLVKRTPGPLPETTVLPWAEQLCDVLTYLHSQSPPVVFRDLKPSNIMVDEQGRIKLIDFGIARFFKPGQQSDTQHMGTAGYSAPEQYGTGQTDARSDIYSLGACLHFLLTRRDPTASPFNFPPLREINPRISPNTERVVAKCLSMKPEDRFASASEVKRALTPRVAEPDTTYLARSAPAAAVRPAPLQSITLPPARKQPWPLIVALLVFIAIAAGVSIYWMQENQKQTLAAEPRQVAVPSVVGMDAQAASQALQQAGLSISFQGSEASDVPVNQIVRQEPQNGYMAVPGSLVQVWQSSGPQPVPVPDVTQLPEKKARKAIRDAGFKVGKVTTEPGDIPAGLVVRTVPTAGYNAGRGQPVDLVLSSGPPQPAAPAQPAPTTPGGEPGGGQPWFHLSIPVPADGKPHRVKIEVKQADGSTSPVFDQSVTDDVKEDLQAPSADSIIVTLDDQPDIIKPQPVTPGSMPEGGTGSPLDHAAGNPAAGDHNAGDHGAGDRSSAPD